jgi:PleD family two-component response regulator
MEEEEYRVIDACDGEDAIAAYSQYSIDLVLLDGKMSRMDGFTCCQRMKDEGRGQRAEGRGQKVKQIMQPTLRPFNWHKKN